MKVLFLGSFVPKEYEYRFPTISAAANQYQNNLIKALKKKCEVVSLSYVTSPKVLPTEEEELVCEKQGCKLFLSKRDGVKACINFRKELKKRLAWADCVICYNWNYAWFRVPSLAAQKKVKSMLILADYTPPIEENRIDKKFFSFLSARDFLKFSFAITLSEGSKKYFKNEQNVLTVNGCVDFDLFEKIDKPSNKGVCNILYTGYLGRVTGVDNLLQAFQKCKNKEARLILCGQGEELDSLIKEATDNDKRIIFGGYVSKEKYIEFLGNADILINPRNMNFKQNQNNFPSKVLEYLAAGRPIISTKFCGFKEFEYNMFFVDSDVDSLYEALEKLMNIPSVDKEKIYLENRNKALQYDWNKYAEVIINRLQKQ